MKNSIQEIIDELTQIIEAAKTNNDPAGYFAALYRKVTIRVRDGILNGEFEDNERMERLDVIFANRYLDAYHQYKTGNLPTQSWAIALKAAQNKKGIILQHLLLGMNAHINLDLGIAAVETIENADLKALKNDFYAINTILAEMVDDVQDRISKASPLFGVLDPLTGRLDEDLMNFSIGIARDGAWEFAENLHLARQQERADIIANRDFRIAVLAENLASPKNRWLRVVLRLIGWTEWSNTTRIIQVLMEEK